MICHPLSRISGASLDGLSMEMGEADLPPDFIQNVVGEAALSRLLGQAIGVLAAGHSTVLGPR